MNSNNEPGVVEPSNRSPRRPYSPPQLAEYGDIRRLTLGPGGTFTDNDFTQSASTDIFG